MAPRCSSPPSWRCCWSGSACSRLARRSGHPLAVRQDTEVDYTPGLHLKWPWDTIHRFERRIITKPYQGETFLTSENKALTVDFYVKWRVKDAAKYFTTTQGIETYAAERLGDNVKDGIKGVVARRTLQEIVKEKRDAFAGDMISRASTAVQELGVELIDVRIQRIDLPDEVSGSVYQRMEQNFKALGNRLRGEGSAERERIQADADRQRTEIVAGAQRDAQKLKGRGRCPGRAHLCAGLRQVTRVLRLLSQPRGLSQIAGA